jgi:hypothetical protein
MLLHDGTSLGYVPTVEYLFLVGLFLLLAGFVVGLGAVTVIDFHGFLARKSAYWTEATTRAHKVTKPLIWTGLFLAIIGGLIVFSIDRRAWAMGIPQTLSVLAFGGFLNGLFLTFGVSRFLLKREKEKKSSEVLPASWQKKIFASFLFSILCWWGSFVIVVLWIATRFPTAILA